ncbi:MAG TPA: flippase activity-associated protein Agl23, partial [Thermoanaerobaculia bacterium]
MSEAETLGLNEAAAGKGSPPVTTADSARSAGRVPAIVVGLFVVAAAFTRFYHLGDRPLHHDESIHAHQSYSLMKDGNWRYDPAYHGPFLYYANALVYRIVGVNNTTARLLPAIFGLLLIAAAIPLSRWIGRRAAIAYALLVLISPHLTYFSRFIREDLYSLVFTLGTVLAFQMFLETDRAKWLTLAAVSFALAGITKENAYMTGVLFVAYGVWAIAERVARSKGRKGAFSETLSATLRWIRARILPLATAALVFLAIWALAYSAFGKYPKDWLAIPKAIKYWMGQHSIGRIPGPPWYYIPQFLYYETSLVFAALFAFRRPEKRDSQFLRFVVFWAIGSLLLYAWAREKVPWLTVHPLLPVTILAAVGLAGLWRDRQEKPARLALAVFAVLAAVNASGMALANFRYGAHDVAREPKHAEILAYVQTTRDLVRALEPLELAKQKVQPGQPVITVAGEASWPLTWYLRDVPTKWVTRVEDATTPIIVSDWESNGGLEKQLADAYTATRVPIRAWWFAERYQPDEKVPARPNFTDLARWWLFHEIWSPIGSQDATFYVRKDLQSSGPLAPLNLRVQNTSARDYSGGTAAVVPPAKILGEPGSGPGQFAEPRGLATDARGNLYVADTKNNRIQVFDTNRQFVRSLGTAGSADGQLKEPCGVTVDSDGSVIVADTWNHRIARFGADGAWLGAFTDVDRGLFGPRAVLMSRDSLYVADTGNKRIVRFDRKWNRVGEWGTSGSGPGQFVEPVGLAADAAGNVYVADTGNHRIQVFDGEGHFLREFAVFGWKDFYT